MQRMPYVGKALSHISASCKMLNSMIHCYPQIHTICFSWLRYLAIGILPIWLSMWFETIEIRVFLLTFSGKDKENSLLLSIVIL